jgi:hypothetical protein
MFTISISATRPQPRTSCEGRAAARAIEKEREKETDKEARVLCYSEIPVNERCLARFREPAERPRLTLDLARARDRFRTSLDRDIDRGMCCTERRQMGILGRVF